MKEIDDITLERAKRGDSKAFDSLYAHYSPFVWRLCLKSTNGDKPRAEEIVQITFVKVLDNLKGFSRKSSFSTWLYRVTYSCICGYFSKERPKRGNERVVMVEFDEEYMGGDDDTSTLPFENRDLFSKVLGALSEADRFLLVAREVDGLSYEELAEVMGVKEGALRTRLTRLKADIRKRLELMGLGPGKS